MKRAITIILVVLFLSIMVITPTARAEGLLSDFFNMIKKWFESSPLGNLFSMPVKRIETIKMSFYPESFEFSMDDFVNISTGTGEISNFKGHMSIDMGNKILVLKEAGSSLSIKETIGEINVEGLKIGSLELKGMKLVLASGNWNETTENGSVTIKDFLGRGLIKEGAIELEGNVSKVIKA
ncbi:MAG: hypothetical protein V3U72_01645 [Candidatus Aenigmarchaeota archaeon]